MSEQGNDWTRDKAFRIGFSWGFVYGERSAREADAILRERNLPTDAEHVTLLCNGSIDGARGDYFRLLNGAVQVPR